MPDRIYLSVPHMGSLEQSFIAEAFTSNWLSTTGPHVEAFEAEVADLLGGTMHALALTSGTAALHLALRAAGVGSGDRVAASTLTFVGSAFPILYLGAEPVFIDSERTSWNIDPNLVEDHFRQTAPTGRLPAALAVVHLYGQHADLDPIAQLCDRYGVTLIEDAAESLGSTYRGRPTGTTGPLAILSFNGNKMITTTGGGMVLARDPDLLRRMRKWANQAREPAVEYVHAELGYNYRLSNVLAAIGRGQLPLLADRVAARQAIAARYAAAFADLDGVELQPVAPWSTHTRWLSVFTFRDHIDTRAVIATLAEQNIEARPVWRPMHTQPLFADAERVGGDVAEDVYRRGICLPSSSSLSEADQDRVIELVRSAVAGLSTYATTRPGR